jgi:serine/threonine protein phosphatase PrpC
VTRYGTDLEGAARELIQQANDHGGPDNITVVLVRIVADGN